MDVDGIWGQDADFHLSGIYENLLRNLHSSQLLKIDLSGSNVVPSDLSYTFQNNQTMLEVQIQVIYRTILLYIHKAISLNDYFLQSSYGKDSVLLYMSREKFSKKEIKVTTKLGYINYLHSAEMMWRELDDGSRAALDIHLDK